MLFAPEFLRRCCTVTIVVCCCLAGFTGPEDCPAEPPESVTITNDDDANAIMTKALESHGGADKVSRWSKGYAKYQVFATVGPPDLRKAILEDTFDLPGHFKRVIHAKDAKGDISVTTVHNHGKGWVKSGKSEAIPNENRFTDRVAHTFADLCDFSKLCNGDAKLTRLPNEKHGDRVAVIVNAQIPGVVDAELIIDKQRGYMIGSRKHVTVPGIDEPVTMNVILDGHKTIQGGVYPTKIRTYHDEKSLIEVNIMELKFFDKVDEKEFRKP